MKKIIQYGDWVYNISNKQFYKILRPNYISSKAEVCSINNERLYVSFNKLVLITDTLIIQELEHCYQTD